MPPAMVDFRFPTSPSSKDQSNGLRSLTGRIPSSTFCDMINSVGIPDTYPFINGSNLGQGVSISTEKPSALRLRKHRKRSGASRSRPATTASDGCAGLDFNPFRSEMPPMDLPDREEDRPAQFVREQLSGWRPFVSDASDSIGTGFVFRTGSPGSYSNLNSNLVERTESTEFDAFEKDRGISDKGIFASGSEMERDSSLNRSWSQRSFAQNSGSANLGRSESEVADNVLFDYTFAFGSSDMNDSDLSRNTFVGSKKDAGNTFSSTSDYGLHCKYPDRTRKIDQDDYKIENFAEAKLDLDQTSSSFTTASSLPKNLRKLKIETYENGNNGKMDSGFFVFSSGVNKSNHASMCSSFETFDASFSKLPDKMEKLHLQSSVGEVYGDSESFGLKKQAQFSQTFSVPDKGDLNKPSLQCPGDQEQNYGTHGVFVFGSDVRKNADSKPFSHKFDESSVSKLPHELQNMKLSCLGKEDSQKSMPWHDNTFVFGCDVTQNANFGTSSPFTFNRNSISKLPDELRNMNLNDVTFSSGKEDSSSKVSPLHAPNLFSNGAETASSHPLPDLIFSSIPGGSEKPKMKFKSQKQGAALQTKDNFITDINKNLIFGTKRGDSKGARAKKKLGKSRQSIPIHTDRLNHPLFVNMGSGDNHQGQDSTGGYSPMDYSPCQENFGSNQCSSKENFGSNQCSRNASSLCNESTHLDLKYTLNEDQKSVFDYRKDGGLYSGTEHFDTNESILENEERDDSFTCLSACVPQKENSETKNEIIASGIQPKSSSLEAETNHSFEGDSGFKFNSCTQDATKTSCLFSTTSVQRPSSSSLKHIFRRKSRVKGSVEAHLKAPFASSPANVSLFLNSNASSGFIQEQKGVDDCKRIESVNKANSYHDFAEESCEKWRLCGNQAYADGNLTKAEDYYSRGVDLFSLEKHSKCLSRALMLCYSNRAATRMTLGRLREALNDCKMAALIDPSFLRAQVRAGNIHLSLGESTNARLHFEKVLQLDIELKFDQKILLEAVDGLDKIEKLNDLVDRCSILLTKGTMEDATKALEIISDALSIAPHSEILLQMKAESLLKFQKFDEVIQLCNKTLEFAEKNFSIDQKISDSDSFISMESSLVGVWRWLIMAKSYFYSGKLEKADEMLWKHEKEKLNNDKNSESSASFSTTIRELLRLKNAGNEAFQAGKHMEAVELYTSVLALNTDSCVFTAICFCNRAAAYQALGQITDAIADCSLAIALNSGYRKAISRRATLHEMIRDYAQAGSDLSKLITFLEMHPEEKNEDSGALRRSSSNSVDLNQARLRLCAVEEARKGGTLDMYKILGVEKLCSAADLRKAYRKAALRHHPDKAGQFLVRGENCDDIEWRRVTEEVRSDADRLFKMIGEAYAILADPNKRLQYDTTEEELRAMKKGYGPYNASNSHRTQASGYNSSHYERSSGRSHRYFYGSTYQY